MRCGLLARNPIEDRMLSVPMFCRAAAALMLAAASAHAPARNPAPPHPADPGAPVPATRYQSQSGYRPAPADSASPDRNWHTQNRIVASYDSMALTMPAEDGAGTHAGHGGAHAAQPAAMPMPPAQAGHHHAHGAKPATHAGHPSPVGWAPRAHADAGTPTAVDPNAHETHRHAAPAPAVPTLPRPVHDPAHGAKPPAQAHTEPAADGYHERPSHGAHASEGRR
jgi:hypothetical protein